MTKNQILEDLKKAYLKQAAQIMAYRESQNQEINMNEDDMKGFINKKIEAPTTKCPDSLLIAFGIMVWLLVGIGLLLELWVIVAIIKRIIGWL